MSAYKNLQSVLRNQPKTWLVTGVAGFIGSNLLETLLKLEQRVVGLDNFTTGHRRNLEEVRALVQPEQWARFEFIEGDIRSLDDCHRAMNFHSSGELVSVDYVLHQAALGSVPRSLEDPINTNASNIDGFLNILVAARDAKVSKFVYAASSSTYGDHPGLPKIEGVIGRPLSPYAVTKYVNELYADVFSRCYGISAVGLRYFNVFGRRQDPEGAYSAVIPRWTASMIRGDDVYINGDGETSRDFCYIDNVVQANLLAASASGGVGSEIYNVAVGGRTTLNELFSSLGRALSLNGVGYGRDPIYREFRSGDVRHSQADIEKAKKILGYSPEFDIFSGVEAAMPWYVDFLSAG